MKKNNNILNGDCAIITINSCKKLDVPVESQYVKSNFPEPRQIILPY